MERQLTAKQKAFCEEYVANGYNGMLAYMKAYESSETTAKGNAYKVAKNPRVQEYIKELQKDAYEQACINAERVALKLAEIAFAQKDDEYYAPNQQLKALDLLQKQLGLQKQKMDANIDRTTEFVVTIDDQGEN